MDRKTTDLVAAIRADYPRCFACGEDNPIGLHISDASLDGEEAVARYSPTENHGGAGRTLHGGLAATVLDEIMVWAAILSHHVLAVTGTLDLRFRRPVTVDHEIVVRGRVEQRSGRRLRCSGVLEVGGTTAVTAGGVYLVARAFESPDSTR